jgi:hypothetical protein
LGDFIHRSHRTSKIGTGVTLTIGNIKCVIPKCFGIRFDETLPIIMRVSELQLMQAPKQGTLKHGTLSITASVAFLDQSVCIGQCGV